MKRDFDLIRKILLEVEKKESPIRWFEVKLEGYTRDQISYHVKILSEAGYLDAKNLTTSDGFEWQPINLTWEGHELLDAARDNKIWNKAKKQIGNKIASVTFEVLKSLLISFGNKEIGL